MKKILLLILALCLVLSACGEKPEDTEPSTEPSTAPTTEATTEPSTEAPTEPEATEAVDVDPLTGEALEEEFDGRPYAIMLNNKDVSLPHHGVAEAGVVYETLVEGGMTRFMAIFSDPEKAGPIGSVRSVRVPFVDVIQCYDAICASAGGANNAIALIRNQGLDHLDAIYDTKYYYRDAYRKDYVGYEHSLFINGDGLENLAADKGIRTTREKEDFGFRFDESVPFGGEPAEKIQLWFHAGGKSTTANYNPDLGAYTLYQYGMDYVDGNTKELVPFRNVFILKCDSYVLSDGVHVHVETVGEGTGYYARDGKLVPIRWSRESVDAPFVYTLEDGRELLMGTGASYIALIAQDGVVEYE